MITKREKSLLGILDVYIEDEFCEYEAPECHTEEFYFDLYKDFTDEDIIEYLEYFRFDCLVYGNRMNENILSAYLDIFDAKVYDNGLRKYVNKCVDAKALSIYLKNTNLSLNFLRKYIITLYNTIKFSKLKDKYLIELLKEIGDLYIENRDLLKNSAERIYLCNEYFDEWNLDVKKCILEDINLNNLINISKKYETELAKKRLGSLFEIRKELGL